MAKAIYRGARARRSGRISTDQKRSVAGRTRDDQRDQTPGNLAAADVMESSAAITTAHNLGRTFVTLFGDPAQQAGAIFARIPYSHLHALPVSSPPPRSVRLITGVILRGRSIVYGRRSVTVALLEGNGTAAGSRLLSGLTRRGIARNGARMRSTSCSGHMTVPHIPLAEMTAAG